MKEVYTTQEPYYVVWYHTVYEIRWAYINPEVSLAYPHATQAYKVPEGYPFWRTKTLCQNKCNFLNRNHPDYKPGKPKPLYDSPRLHPV